MKDTVKTAAYGLLKNLAVDEIEDLIQVLSYYNSKCKPESRAACLANGCTGEKTASERLIEQRTAGSTGIYMSGGQSVCPCCKR